MQLMILHTKHTHTYVTSTQIRGQKLSGPDNPLLLSSPFQLPLVSPPHLPPLLEFSTIIAFHLSVLLPKLQTSRPTLQEKL